MEGCVGGLIMYKYREGKGLCVWVCIGKGKVDVCGWSITPNILTVWFLNLLTHCLLYE